MDAENAQRIVKSLEAFRSEICEKNGERNLPVVKSWYPGLGACFIVLLGDNRDYRPVVMLDLCLIAMKDFPELKFSEIGFTSGDRSLGIRFPAPSREKIPDAYLSPALMHMIRTE